MRLFAAIVITLVAALAQSGDVTLSPGPPRQPFAILNDYDGSGNLIYVGKAATPTSFTHTFSVATCGTANCSAMTNIVDSTNTGTVTAANHGLRVGNQVCVTGASDADLNTCYLIQTVADANTFTITTANVTDSTYTTSVTITTRAPRSTANLWTVQQFLYDGSGNLASVQSSAQNQAWSSRTTLTYR